jgi:hypothetical protein
MSKRRKEKAAEIQKAIGTVLLYDWDPIGTRHVPAAQDESNSYVGGVYRLLSSGSSEYQVIRHLNQIETVSMGLPERNPDDLRDVAKKLLE